MVECVVPAGLDDGGARIAYVEDEMSDFEQDRALTRLLDQDGQKMTPMRWPATSIRNGCAGSTNRVKWSLLVSVLPLAANVRTRSMWVISVPSGFVIVVNLKTSLR